MNPITAWTKAARGWAELLMGRTPETSKFDITLRGLIMALALCLLAIILAMAAQSAIAGMPSALEIGINLLGAVLALAGMTLVIRRTTRFLKLETGLLPLLVPAVYAVSYALLIEIILAGIAPALGLVLLLVVVFMLFRLGRIVAGMNWGVALAFGLLSVLVLVALPQALYMLVQTFIPAA